MKVVFLRKGFQEPGVVPRHFLTPRILFIAVMGAALPNFELRVLDSKYDSIFLIDADTPETR